jgi:uncharacterized protein (UPF0332 family)
VSNDDIINYWIAKAYEDIASAEVNCSAGRYLNAIRDSYFSCFHAFTSVLLADGKSFKKHKEVRSILHREYIREGKIDVPWGKHYDWLFDNRQKADYRPLVTFDPGQAKEIIEKSNAFLLEMKKLLKNR